MSEEDIIHDLIQTGLSENTRRLEDMIKRFSAELSKEELKAVEDMLYFNKEFADKYGFVLDTPQDQ